jgi:hypothetical protein
MQDVKKRERAWERVADYSFNQAPGGDLVDFEVVSSRRWHSRRYILPV